jgi:hypothetical protein
MLSFSSLFGSTDADSLERLDRMILRGPELHFHEIADDADNFSQHRASEIDGEASPTLSRRGGNVAIIINSAASLTGT